MLSTRRSLPLYPDKQPIQNSVGTSQSTKLESGTVIHHLVDRPEREARSSPSTALEATGSTPANRILQPVVAPEKLTIHRECR